MRIFAILLILASTFRGFCSMQPAASTHESEHNYLQIVCRKYPLDSPGIPLAILRSLYRPASLIFKEKRGAVWQATQRGLIETDSRDNSKRVLTGKDGLPILSV